VLTHLTSNPIFGTGLGNWKLKSIDYDSKDINGYVVPYHAHSDFIQLGAELGIIGFLLYLGVFLWAVYYVFVFIRSF
jgi:O-antigen ligase